MIEETIRKRTKSGSFARLGSSGTRARRYNRQYARRARKNAAGPVDLYVTGDLYSSIKGRARINKKSVSASARVEGSSAKQKWRWLEVEGAGRSRIKRRFMYLTKTEADKIARAMIRAGFGR